MRVRYFIFLLTRNDIAARRTRVVGAALIAGETPMYIGRLHIGSNAIDDLSHLAIPGQITDRLAQDITTIATRAGAEVGRESQELFTLFDDPEMTERNTTATFVREGERLSFVRKTDRYEQLLREFVAEQQNQGD